MRHQYRIRWPDGKVGTCITSDRIYDSLRHFRNRFGESIQSVDERLGDGPWKPSHLLPTSAEEAASINFDDNDERPA